MKKYFQLPRVPRMQFWLLLTVCVQIASAQTTTQVAAPSTNPAPAKTSDTPVDDETLVLDIFSVTGKRDVGFVAKDSMAGGRINTDLADTPVAYSVQTREFLEALNLTDLVSAQQWAPNVVATPDDGGDSMFGGTGMSTVRGMNANAQQKNFNGAAPSLQGGMNFDTYNLERLDYTRGPNSILFGTGGMGGTANAVSKQAYTHKQKTIVGLEMGSWYHKRSTLDHNQPLGRMFAFRLNGMWQQGQGWQDYAYENKSGLSGSLVFDYKKNTRIILNGEYTESRKQQPYSSMVDRFSAWDGVSTFARGQTGDTRAVGAYRNADAYYVYSPSSTGGTLVNWGRMISTRGTNTNPTTAEGIAVPTGAQNVNFDDLPLVAKRNVPTGIYDRALAGAHGLYIPSTDKPVFFDDIGNLQRFRNLTLQLDQRVGDHFLVQLAGDYVKRKAWGNIGEWNSTSRLFIDINNTLPTGEANPNVLKPYIESSGMENSIQNITAKTLRASMAYVRKFSWVDAKFNAMGAVETYRNEQERRIYVLPVSSDTRVWGANLANSRKIYYRQYFDQADRSLPTDFGNLTTVDPIFNADLTPRANNLAAISVAPTTNQLTPVWALNTSRPDSIQEREQTAQYLQMAANLGFFKRRLILLGALRRDFLHRELRYSKSAMDYPEGADPLTPIWRPDAPEDFFFLKYVPRNASGVPVTTGAVAATTRPRLAVSNPATPASLADNGKRNPFYADDRFQDDYNPPKQDLQKTTFSFGGVVNVTPWFSLLANYAETFNPVDANFPNMDFSMPTPAESSGFDYGVRFNLLKGKFVIGLNRYDAKEEGVSFRVQNQNMNNIAKTNAIGDHTTDGINQRNMTFHPGTDYWNTRDYRASGYELDIVANITPQWRLMANGALAEAKQTNAYSELISYFAANEAVARQVLADAGVTIDPVSNVASSPSVATGAPLNTYSPDRTIGRDAWNNHQNFMRNIVSGSQDVNRSTDYTANVYTDYRINSGFLKNLRPGFGIQFRGRQVIGYRGADTMVNPTNHTQTIDDPAVDAYTTVTTKPYYFATAALGYKFRVFDKPFDVNLTVTNLFNYRGVLYYNTTMRPPGGDVTDRVRVATASVFSQIAPRAFRLAVRCEF